MKRTSKGTELELIILEIDSIVNDICRIKKSVRSEYIFPKSILSGARANVRSDPKKCLNLCKDARQSFIHESELITNFNLIIGEYDSTDEKVKEVGIAFQSMICCGEYSKCERYLRDIKDLNLPRVCDELSITLLKNDEFGCVLNLCNSSKSVMMVMGLECCSDSDSYVCVPQVPFSIQSGSTRQLSLAGSNIFQISISYTVRGKIISRIVKI